jgi:hypothetical protein
MLLGAVLVAALIASSAQAQSLIDKPGAMKIASVAGDRMTCRH